ncbi:MAG: Cro/CI family transcriptional regulator [Phreatobacter sp.]|uniref:Cro/CI family transcriptional regulator n=1 Tax=Phreatobacter sp. TaxID=1966341 RepID=UPI0027374B8B|nr:Cro/CI family transcriptional regulator [Phreatobacter sp.]MDP2802835.1 Cro/CI family transcriptional regulator [Phreatobacter sp.]
MRERGLEEAIKAVGGVGALARALGISQPSVSSWSRVPPERVIAVEKISGVGRHVLRPDIYPESRSSIAVAMEAAQDRSAGVDEMDRLRSAEYGLLALLLFRVPTADVLGRVAALKGDVSPLGMAHLALAKAASEASVEAVNREFFDLFVGVGRGELLPYASYYLTGFLHERPLAAVRQSFVDLAIIRDDDSREPEDHIALLFDVMANLAVREIGQGYETEKAFFEAHLKPWAGRFFADLESMTNRPFYAAVGAVGRLFVAIEDEAFSFDA